MQRRSFLAKIASLVVWPFIGGELAPTDVLGECDLCEPCDVSAYRVNISSDTPGDKCCVIFYHSKTKTWRAEPLDGSEVMFTRKDGILWRAAS